MSSIKGNVILNGVNTISGIIFPVITFPYAARVLLPEGIGTVNFLNSIISYIVLLTSVGIPMYAVKEIAKYRNEKQYRNKIAIEILILSFALCVSGYFIVWILGNYVRQIHSHLTLFYVLSLSIVFTTLGANWFYQGIEDFKFITIRAVLIRALAAISLFLFVKNSSDLVIYGIIIVGSTVGNNLINFFHLRKHINIRDVAFKDLNIIRHIRPAFKVFILNLIISLYIQLNSVMLGFIAGDDAVGFFAAGTKISHIGLTIIASMSTVLLPRCSNLIKTGEMEVFRRVIAMSLNITLALSIPMTVGLMILAAPITIKFCGIQYADAIPVLILNAPVVIFISLTNLMGIQILYPKEQIRIVIESVLGGAIINVLLNFVLLPPYGATGAAISTLIAEFTVLLIQIIRGRQYYPFNIKALLGKNYLIGSIIMGLGIYFSINHVNSITFKLIVGIAVGIVTYLLYLLITKDPILSPVKSYVYKRCGLK